VVLPFGERKMDGCYRVEHKTDLLSLSPSTRLLDLDSILETLDCLDYSTSTPPSRLLSRPSLILARFACLRLASSTRPKSEQRKWNLLPISSRATCVG
jgi:hypothetical protein